MAAFRIQIYDDGSGEYLFDAPVNYLNATGREYNFNTVIGTTPVGPFILTDPKAVTKPGLLTLQISNVNAPLNDGGESANEVVAYIALVFAVPKKCKGQNPSGAGVRPGVLG